MDFLRNKEIKRFVLLLLAAAALMTAVGLAMSLEAGLWAMVLSFLFSSLFLGFSRRRYNRIAAMSAQIDRMLHGQESLSISGYEEGELAIMQSELQKITVRLREQADNLRKDKIYLSDSIADIAHQIRTPLTSINLLASLLAREGLDNARRLELVRELEILLARIDWLITALLKISKLDAGTAIFKATDMTVDSLIDKALEPFTISLELRNVTIERAVSGTVRCDLSWTAEALGNILKNGLEHLPQDGMIRIEAEETAIYTQISVSDNGKGFVQEDLPHVFERFYKGKNAGNSNFGIGLALSHMIITRQNGTVKAEKNKPRGARFVIRFYRDQTL